MLLNINMRISKSEYLNLRLLGKKVSRQYYVNRSESDFKTFAKTKLLFSDDLNPFRKKKLQFVGFFQKDFDSEFIIKFRTFFWTQDNFNESLVINGKITEMHTDHVIIDINYEMDRLLNTSNLIVTPLLIFFLIYPFFCFYLLFGEGARSFLFFFIPYTSFIFIFYLLGYADVNKKIEHFENVFLDNSIS